VRSRGLRCTPLIDAAPAESLARPLHRCHWLWPLPLPLLSCEVAQPHGDVHAPAAPPAHVHELTQDALPLTVNSTRQQQARGRCAASGLPGAAAAGPLLLTERQR